MKTFLTADWHLGENRFELMGRPFTSEQEMVHKLTLEHNLRIGDEDTVIVVGDVCYQKRPDYLKYVSWFNGRKILIRGNHDRGISDEEFKPYFEQIIPEGEGLEADFGGIQCYVTHYPTCGVKDRFNLVGHIHGAWKYQLNMLNIGVDVNHYRPVDSDRIPFHFKAIAEFYDEDVWVANNPINAEYIGKRGKKGTYFTKV